MNENAIETSILYLERLIEFIKKDFPYDIKGASLLFIIDHINNDLKVKLIDLASVTKYDNSDERDEGFIAGLEKIKEILECF